MRSRLLSSPALSALLSWLTAALALGSAGCAGDRAGGLAATDRQGGPRVVFDLEARPLPEIPLPNDAATRLDPTSPTGRRLNVSEEAPTELERRMRRKFDKLDGFGTYAPITVRFDAPLDIEDLYHRHNDDDDFRNDAVLLLNVDPHCRRYGEEIALDLGRGRFPITLYRRSSRVPDSLAPGGYRVDDGGNTLFDFDPRGEHSNLLFEERNEDTNGNGRLDPGEDADGDGVLGVANFRDPRACDGEPPGTPGHDRCVADQLMGFYERATNTLIARPVWPLEQRCEHAVVLTRRLRGEDGRPVESPFPAVNHRDQTRALAPIADMLPRYGLSIDDVAFAWSFVTGSQTNDLEALRAGLHGAGAFARLATEHPTSSLHFWSMGELTPKSKSPDRRVIPGPCAGEALSRFWAEGISEWKANRCALDAEFSSIGGVIGGTFEAPNLLADKDGVATDAYPADDDENWEMDASAGTATYGTSRIPFWCVLPVEKASGCSPGNPEGRAFCKPFPVVLFAHGYGSSRAEITNFAGRHTEMGVAMCGLDSYGHGQNRTRQDAFAGQALLPISISAKELDVVGLRELMTIGRDRDLNNDGFADSGADMWSADIFHTRDMLRQSVLEYMQFVRILRAMDGQRLAADGSVLGDADGDGAVDIGGPANTIAMWGISLGGVISGVAAGAEPGLDAVSPNAGGAGLSDIAVRSSQPGVPEEVHLPVAGPFVMGCLPADEHQRPLPAGAMGERDCFTGEPGKAGQVAAGTLRLAFLLHDIGSVTRATLGEVSGVAPGDRVTLENLDNGERKTVTLDARGRFRVAVPADALTPTSRRPVLGLHDGDVKPVRFTDTAALGDRLRITVTAGEGGGPKAVLDTFPRDVTFQGTTYPEGAPLVALQQGFGLERNTPEYRRFLALALHALGSADPAIWEARSFLDPIDTAYDEAAPKSRMHVLVMPTLGDQNVPVNTGIAAGRAAGLLGSYLREPEKYGPEQGWRELFSPDPRYGKSIDREMIERYVVEGDGRLQRYPDNPVNPNVLYDIDDVSDGTASFSCGPSDWSAGAGESGCPDDVLGQEVFFGVPHPEPGKALRQDRARGDGSFDAFRIPMLRPAGQHGLYNAQSFRVFDADAYMVSFTVRFLASRGRAVGHEAGCDCSASGLGNLTVSGVPQDTALEGVACTAADLKICSTACAAAFGIVTPSEAACLP